MVKNALTTVFSYREYAPAYPDGPRALATTTQPTMCLTVLLCDVSRPAATHTTKRWRNCQGRRWQYLGNGAENTTAQTMATGPMQDKHVSIAIRREIPLFCQARRSHLTRTARWRNICYMKTVSETLRKVIEDSGLTRCQIARESGVCRISMLRWLNGTQKTITTDMIDALAEYFQMELKPKSKGSK